MHAVCTSAMARSAEWSGDCRKNGPKKRRGTSCRAVSGAASRASCAWRVPWRTAFAAAAVVAQPRGGWGGLSQAEQKDVVAALQGELTRQGRTAMERLEIGRAHV